MFVDLLSGPRSLRPVPPVTVVNMEYLTLTNLSLSDGDFYRVELRGCGYSGICSTPSPSLSILVDSSPPLDGYFAVSSASVANLSRTVPGGMTWRNRPVRGVAELNIAFLGFLDPHSDISEYWAAVGTDFGGSNLFQPAVIHPMIQSSIESMDIYLATVTLNRVLVVSERVFISLWAVNGVGLRSRVVQASFQVDSGAQSNNGSLSLLRSPSCEVISCMGHCTCAARGDLCNLQQPQPCTNLSSASVSPDMQLHVFNIVPQISLQLSDSVPLFTSITDQLFGGWELVESASTAIQRLEWTVGLKDNPPGSGLMDTVDNNVWREAGSPNMHVVFTVSADYPLLNGEVYVFHVRTWYSDDRFAIFTSEGVTVDVRGPQVVMGYRVREGSENSRDLDFITKPSVLPVAWDGVFSKALSGNYSFFEVGLGTSPGSDDVYPLTSVPSTWMSIMLSNLSLEQGVTYYSMVRTTNSLEMATSSISDGAVLDVTPPIVGTVIGGLGIRYRGSLAQANTDMFSARWFGFSDPESEIAYYELAVTNTTSLPPQYSNVGIRLQATFSGPTLMLGQTYYAHIRATNRAGLSSADVSSPGVLIQDQQPIGQVCIERGPEVLMNPSFENTSANGVPCPTNMPSLSVATYHWSTDSSYVSLATYPHSSPTDGCYALSFIGTIRQEFHSVPGMLYHLSFSYRAPLHAGLRVQSPGIDEIFYTQGETWLRGAFEFTADGTVSYISFSSASPGSVVTVDGVSISMCATYRNFSSTGATAEWPQVIAVNNPVISSPRTKIAAEWAIEDPVSGIREYWWAIGTVQGGEQLQAYTFTGSHKRATSDVVSVMHGETVHISVVAVSIAGSEVVVYSGDQIVVDFTPPPSVLIDGAGPVDVDYQNSMLVAVNWQGMVDPESGLDFCAWAVGMLNSYDNFVLMNLFGWY